MKLTEQTLDFANKSYGTLCPSSRLLYACLNQIRPVRVEFFHWHRAIVADYPVSYDTEKKQWIQGWI
jgi:hypothetical protein